MSRRVKARLFERDTPLQFENRPNQMGRPSDNNGPRRRRPRRHHNNGNQPQRFMNGDPFPQQEFTQPSGPPPHTALKLGEMSKTELNEVSKEFDIQTPLKLKKD